MSRYAALCLLFLLTLNPLEADESSAHQVGLRNNPPNVWALIHGRVVCDGDTTIEDATIIVRSGKVTSVKPQGSVPADARAIDCTGKTIYPGFIDAYSETELSASRLDRTAKYWNPNTTPQLSVAEQIPADTANAGLRKQGIVAQLVAPSEGVVRGQSAVLSTGTESINHRVLATNAAQHLELTVSSRGRDVYPGSPMGAVALARQTLYDAQWYRDAWQAANGDPALPRPETNDALAALQAALERGQPIVVETSNEQFFLRADRFAAEFGLNLIVRGSGREYRRLEEIAASGRPVILPLNFSQPPNVSTAELANNVTLQSLMHWDLAPENPARVDAAGIPIAFCTDRLDSTGDFLKAVRTAVERGLSQESALRALTETPAGLLGLADQLGTIEKGKLASFVVTDGDLFKQDTKVTETWVAGNRFQHLKEPTTDVVGSFELQLPRSKIHPAKLFVELKQDKNRKLSGRLSTAPLKAEPAGSKQTDKEAQKKAKAATASDTPPVITLRNVRQSEFAVNSQFATKDLDLDLDGIARLSLVVTPGGNPSSATRSVSGRIIWPDGSTVSVIAAELQPEMAANDDEEKDDKESDETKLTGKEATDPETKESADDKTASFAVNYPFGAYGREQLPEVQGLTAFQHATIWTSGPAGIIDDGTLLIDDGKIIAVGKDIQIPENATVIDVSGMHITPGIIDCHSHMATDGGVNESTQAITCEVRIGDFIDNDDITIYRQLAGGVTTSNILHGSANPIGGQNQVIKLRWGMTGEDMKFAEAPAGVKFALGENVKQSNWGDDYRSRYPQTRMGVEQVFRTAFIEAREYAIRMKSWQKNRRGLPPRRDLELDALREIVEHKRWIHCHSYRQDEILALIRVLDEFDITIGTFQHILEGYKVADAMAKHGAMGSAFSDWWAYKFEVYDGIPYAGALMHNAGVVVSFNSDDRELARHLNQEAAKAVKYGGIAPAEALKFVTLNPAKQLRIEQYVGSLEAGKHADFVVWNKSPMSNFARCEQTWIDGRRYFHREEDNQLRAKIATMRNTLIQKILNSGEKMRGEEDADDDPTALWPRFDEFCRANGQGVLQKHE